MLLNKKVIQCGGLASILWFAPLTTGSLLAQAASPSGSPSPSASVTPAEQAPKSTLREIFLRLFLSSSFVAI